MGTPTTFGDADANAFKKGDLFRRRYVPFWGQGNRVARVDRNSDVGQLTLEKGSTSTVSGVICIIPMLI